MVTLLVTLDDPNPKPPQFLHFTFHIFVVGKYRDFKFGVLVDLSKSKPTDDKLSLKVAWSRHMTNFQPSKYLWNGLS